MCDSMHLFIIRRLTCNDTCFVHILLYLNIKCKKVLDVFPTNMYLVFNIYTLFQCEEDVSEEAIAARHNRSEELERKKFLQYLHMHVTSRSSRSRRTDSSGTNTPG